MKETEKEARTVALRPEQFSRLYMAVYRARAQDRFSTRRIDAADDELSAILNMRHKLDGNCEFEPPKEEAGYEFSRMAVHGVKIALVQAIAGDPATGARPSVGDVKHVFLPLARAFGIERLVAKESGWTSDEPEEKGPALSFDDEEPDKCGTEGA